jgi:hypothetical protein
MSERKGQAQLATEEKHEPDVLALANEFNTQMEVLRGLFDLVETQEEELEQILEDAAGEFPWNPGGIFTRTPQVSSRADAWRRRRLVMMGAEENLLAELEKLRVALETMAEMHYRATTTRWAP